MATAKKAAPKAAKVEKKVTAPAKAAKPVAKAAAKKAPVSKTAKAIAKLGEQIAKLTERKNKIGAEIAALRDQRTALKTAAAAVVAAPAAPKAKGSCSCKSETSNESCRQEIRRRATQTEQALRGLFCFWTRSGYNEIVTCTTFDCYYKLRVTRLGQWSDTASSGSGFDSVGPRDLP
jgi:hypothetical protein